MTQETLVDANTASMRYSRQTDLLTPDKCGKKIHVIGAGATGSFLVLALAKMGLTDITVFDNDTIEEHNFPNQMFPLKSKGENKALALKEVVLEYTGLEIKSIPHFFDGNHELEGIVISALDSMKGRKLIFESIKDNPKVEFLIDPRCGPELFRILTVDNSLSSSKEMYEKTLHSDEEVDQVPCTARSIIYSVLNISAFLANQVKRHIMNEDYKSEVIIDMKNHVAFFGE